MEKGKNYILFTILRSVVHSNLMSDADKRLMTDDLLKEVIKQATKHDIAHLIALGVLNNELASEEYKPQLQQIAFLAVYRHERMNGEYQKLCNILEEAQIPFLPLKGSVIRKYYPEPWMRTSCDIDILVHEEECERVKSILVDEYDYVYRGKGSHDISFFSPNNIHVELHHNLIEAGIRFESSEVLKSVWDTATVRDGYSYWYEMSDEMYYFYHIAYMAKHFENGGCGIRPFIDLYILDDLLEIDVDKRNTLLEKGKLLKFANAARKLSKVWLANAEQDLVSKKMEDYILRGGVYGNSENRITLQQQKKGGQVKYVLAKMFIPYNEIKFLYPILQKYRWLTPVMEVRRWFKFVFYRKETKRVARELAYNNRVTNSEAENMKTFLSEIGLY